MYLKALVWGTFLFGIIFWGENTRQRLLIAHLNQEYWNDSPLSIHKSGTLLKYTAEAEYEIPLLPAITEAYSHGYSESLISYLSHHQGKIVPYWETPLELRFELELLAELMIQQRNFTVVNPLDGRRHTRFTILPESDDYELAFAYEDGTTFYKKEKPRMTSISCGLLAHRVIEPPRWFAIVSTEFCMGHNQGPDTVSLEMTLNKAQPDLSLDFIRMLANSDPTIY